MPKAAINGVQIYYESYGKGFPLILAYGIGCSTKLWKDQVADLSKKHRLILWDPRGQGQSESPQDPTKYSIPISAEDLLGLMDLLDIPKAYVGGNSLGAGVATVFTLKHPERVEALLLFNSATCSGLPVRSELRPAWEKHIEIALTKGMQPIVDDLASHPDVWVTAKLDPIEMKGVKRDFRGLDPVAYASCVRAILENPLRSEQLSSITIPTLVLSAEHDPALPLMKVVAEKISDATFVEIKGAGHLSNLDDPQAFNLSVVRFLEKVGRQRQQK